MDPQVAAIIPAAGAGRRFGGRISKPFVDVQGAPLLVHTLRAFQQSPSIRWIIVVTQPEALARTRQLLKRYRITKALAPCPGGASRSESVAKGFAALPRDAKWVVVHDGARPCVSVRLIEASVRAATRWGAVACGLPAGLTIKAVDGRGEVRLTLDRDHLWFVQTPQAFRRDWFADALALADHHLEQFPDDTAILEAVGFHVRMIPGDPLNLKVTTKDDLMLAEAILMRRNIGKSKVRSQQ